MKLTEKLITFFESLGVKEVKACTKKHIRRKLEAEFGDSLLFIQNKNGNLFAIPDSLSKENLALKYISAKVELDTYQKAQSNSAEILNKAALFLRKEVKQIHKTNPGLQNQKSLMSIMFLYLMYF